MKATPSQTDAFIESCLAARADMLEQVLSAIAGEVHDRVLDIENSAVSMAAGLSAVRD